MQAEAIETYLRSKDQNRPDLMKLAFAQTAILEMAVNTAAISFPPISNGLDAITKVLVADFGNANENVYTFCLTRPPKGNNVQFSCDWLVGMSLKESGAVRVGCGRYDWFFQTVVPGLVERLKITIDAMEVLPAENLVPVMGWLSKLPYPWCLADEAIRAMPTLAELAPVRNYLERSGVPETTA
jgi:hypothetical protein